MKPKDSDFINDSKSLFNLPLAEMIRLIDDADQADAIKLKSTKSNTPEWFEIFREQDNRHFLLDARISFELGLRSPGKFGSMESNVEMAESFLEAGWISRERYNLALSGKKSLYYELATERAAKIKADLENQINALKAQGFTVENDGSASFERDMRMLKYRDLNQD